MAESFLSQLFLPHNVRLHVILPQLHQNWHISSHTQIFDQLTPSPIPVPISMWELRSDYASRRDSVWAVFRSHEEVCSSSFDGFLLQFRNDFEILKRWGTVTLLWCSRQSRVVAICPSYQPGIQELFHAVHGGVVLEIHDSITLSSALHRPLYPYI